MGVLFLLLDKAATLMSPEGCVDALLRDQFFVRAVFNDLAVFEHDDPVEFRDRTEAMRDHDTCAVFHERIETGLDELFAFAIEGARRFIENQDRSVLEYRPGNSYALALSS